MSDYEPTREQEKAIREYLHESIVPLIEQVLVKKLGQAMSFAAEQLVQLKREWQELTDDEIEALASWWPSYDQMPALKVLIKDVTNSLKEKNT